MDRYPFSFDGNKVAQNIADMLNEIAEHAGSSEQIKIKACFKSPDVEEVKECFRRNCTVWGTLTLSPAGERVWDPVEIQVLYPYHGVFVTGNGNGRFDRPAEARLMVWRPCLARRPGLWLLRTPKKVKNSMDADDDQGLGSDNPGDVYNAERVTVSELGMAANFSISTENLSKAIKKQEKKEADKDKRPIRNEKRCLQLPHLTKETLEGIVKIVPSRLWENAELKKFLLDPKNLMLDQAGVVKALTLMEEVLQSARDFESLHGGRIFLDSEDLATRHLCTYEVYLAELTVQLICNRWFLNDGTADSSYWSGADGFELGRETQRQIMNPRRGGYAWLRPLDCGNAAEAVSSLTAISRFGWGDGVHGDPVAAFPAEPSLFRRGHLPRADPRIGYDRHQPPPGGGRIRGRWRSPHSKVRIGRARLYGLPAPVLPSYRRGQGYDGRKELRAGVAPGELGAAAGQDGVRSGRPGRA
jgi:hypothetical protein